MRQWTVVTESPCCWNQLERELSVSMKLLFLQVKSSDLESGPVDKSGNHFDGSRRVALAHSTRILWSCLACWNRHTLMDRLILSHADNYRSSGNGSTLLRLLLICPVELFADARPIMLIIEVWVFLVLSLLVSSLLIVLSISWRHSLFDSVASLF